VKNVEIVIDDDSFEEFKEPEIPIPLIEDESNKEMPSNIA